MNKYGDSHHNFLNKFEDMKKDDPIVVLSVSMKLSEKKQIKEKAIKQRRTVSGFMTVKALDILNF